MFSDLFTCLYLKLRFVPNTFWTKIPKSRHSGPLETCRNKAYCKIYTVLESHQPNGGYLPRFPFSKAISFFDEKTFFYKAHLLHCVHSRKKI